MTTGADLERAAVVVLTRNRRELVRDVLRVTSTWSVGGIVVVDNASTDGTLEMIGREFPDTIRVASETNLGATGGRNLGLAAAQEHGFAYAFLAEDDTVSDRAALTKALDVMAAVPDAVLVGPSGGSFRQGRVRWADYRRSFRAGGHEVRSCDFVHLDSCLVRLDHPAAAGWMRSDFFIMFEEQEWGLRIVRNGGRVLCAPSSVDRMHVGAATSTRTNPWRSYYQTRNYLRFCLDARLARLWIGFLGRTAHQLVVELAGRRWASLRLRAKGVRDALAGRMGLQVEPGDQQLPPG